MLRNLPEGFDRKGLEALLDSEGFERLYDFIYLPIDMNTGVAFEYCFINFTNCMAASRFFHRFNGFNDWPSECSCSKEAGVQWSEALQGLDDLTERYRNSPLMHPSVADEFRPAIYSRGQRVAFPAPTAKIRMPRVRKNRKRTPGEALQSVAEEGVEASAVL